MGSTSGPSQQQNQTQNATSAPWGPTQPLLTNLIGTLGQQGTGVTPQQSAGATQLLGAANAIPNLGPTAQDALTGMFNWNTAGPQGILGSAYSNLQGTLSPLTDPANLNPYNTPGFSTALGTSTQDTMRQIQGMFSGAGRSFSPDDVQALARGISQGTAPTIAGQYNTNVGNLMTAAQNLYGAGAGTAGQTAALQQMPFQQQLQAITSGLNLPQLYTAGPQAALAAANAMYGLPYSNLSQLEGLALPIAGLGGQTTGASTTTTTSQEPLFNTLLGAGMLGLGTYGKLASDERVKTDIQPVGLLFNELPVYSFRYRHDPQGVTHLGLLAQEVERVHPEAVAKDEAGIRYVDYGLATMPTVNQVPA